MTQRIYYCYAHIDSSNSEVFYIGKGLYHNNGRAQRYESKKDRNKWHLNKWNKCLTLGTFVVKVFFESTSEEEVFQMERDAIAFYGRKDIGTGNLLNMTDGGDGVSGSICSYRGQKRDPSVGVAISKAKKGKFSGLDCHLTDKTIYKFVHIDGRTEECTMNEFYTKHKLPSTNISRLVRGKCLSVKGWYLNHIKQGRTPNKKDHVDDDTLRREYENGASLIDLYTKYDITPTAIRKRIINCGGRTRSFKEAQKLRFKQ